MCLTGIDWFIHVVNKKDASIGAIVCFEDELTILMIGAARAEGYFKGWKFDKIQIITVEDLLKGKDIKILYGMEETTFTKASKKMIRENDQVSLYND